jgi:hypothetical protein
MYIIGTGFLPLSSRVFPPSIASIAACGTSIALRQCDSDYAPLPVLSRVWASNPYFTATRLCLCFFSPACDVPVGLDVL